MPVFLFGAGLAWEPSQHSRKRGLHRVVLMFHATYPDILKVHDSSKQNSHSSSVVEFGAVQSWIAKCNFNILLFL